MVLRQDGVASHNPRAIMAIKPHQSTVTQAKYPARGFHTSRSQAHGDIIVTQLVQSLKDSRRGAEIQARLRECVAGAARGTTSASGHGEARARLFEKLSGTFERPAAACTLAAVARTCHSVQQVALHDISLSRKKLLTVLDA